MVADVGGGGGRACVEAGSVWSTSVPSFIFHCERKTSLKQMSFKNLAVVTNFSYFLENTLSLSLL